MTAQRVATITYDSPDYFAFIGTSEDGTMLGYYPTMEAAADAIHKYAHAGYIVPVVQAHKCSYCGEPSTYEVYADSGKVFRWVCDLHATAAMNRQALVRRIPIVQS